MKTSLLILAGALAAPIALPAADEPAGPPADERREKMRENADRLAERLDLSDEQRTKLKAINAEAKKELDALRGADLAPEERRTKARAVHDKYHEQRMALLTPEQRTKAAKMREWGEKMTERREKREERREKRRGGDAK